MFGMKLRSNFLNRVYSDVKNYSCMFEIGGRVAASVPASPSQPEPANLPLSESLTEIIATAGRILNISVMYCPFRIGRRRGRRRHPSFAKWSRKSPLRRRRRHLSKFDDCGGANGRAAVEEMEDGISALGGERGETREEEGAKDIVKYGH